MSESVALVPTSSARSEIAVRRERPELLLSEEQQAMIRDSYASGASPAEFAVLLEIAKAKRLNPLLGQIHFVKRWDNAKGREVWAHQTSIDGFRSIAEDTGLYDGQDEPEFTYDPKIEDRREPLTAKVRVYRKDIGRAFVGVAHFEEYAQYKSQKSGGGLTKMWEEKPHVMLAKCAEALAFRKAFPLDLGDMHTPDEMGEREDPGERLAARAVGKLESPPAELPHPRGDYAKLIAEAKTEKECDAIAKRIGADPAYPLGSPPREAMLVVFRARKAEILAAEAAAPKVPKQACEECGLLGSHAGDCPVAEPVPAADEERQPGDEG